MPSLSLTLSAALFFKTALCSLALTGDIHSVSASIVQSLASKIQNKLNRKSSPSNHGFPTKTFGSATILSCQSSSIFFLTRLKVSGKNYKLSSLINFNLSLPPIRVPYVNYILKDDLGSSTKEARLMRILQAISQGNNTSSQNRQTSQPETFTSTLLSPRARKIRLDRKKRRKI